MPDNTQQPAPAERRMTDLLRDLRESVGIGRGEIWIVHSSMKSIGSVIGGPAAVIHALEQAVGPAGTLLMPTFSDPQPDGRFDLLRTPSRTGLITETFRTMPGVRRSRHPTHSVAAWGCLRDELLDGHEHLQALGIDSPFHKAAKRGAKVLMIGCDLTRTSLLHVAEAIVGVPYLGRACYPGYDRPLVMIDELGRQQIIEPRPAPGDSSQFFKVEARLRQRGRLTNARLGEAVCLCFQAEDTLHAAIDLLRDDPLAFLCNSPRCVYCTAARHALDQCSPAFAAADR
jgi:aminoglycoside N3'-acetyltransferase